MTLLSWYILWTTAILLSLSTVYILSELRHRRILNDIQEDVRFLMFQLRELIERKER